MPGVTAGTIVRFHLSNPVPHGCVHSVCRAQAETTQSFPVDSDLRLCNDVGGEIVDNVNGDTGDADVGGEASVVGGSGVVLRLSYPKVGSGVAGATSTCWVQISENLIMKQENTANIQKYRMLAF